MGGKVVGPAKQAGDLENRTLDVGSRVGTDSQRNWDWVSVSSAVNTRGLKLGSASNSRGGGYEYTGF